MHMIRCVERHCGKKKELQTVILAPLSPAQLCPFQLLPCGVGRVGAPARLYIGILWISDTSRRTGDADRGSWVIHGMVSVDVGGVTSSLALVD